MEFRRTKTSPRKEIPAPGRIAIFLLLMLVALSGLARLFDYAAKMDHREKAHWVTEQRDQAYDFAVLGASRSYMGLDIAALEKGLDQKGINLSLEGATYPEQYLVLKLFLANNHIDHLIMDLSMMDFDNSVLRTPFHAYRFLPNIGNDDVFDCLRDSFGFRAYLWKFIPFFKNAEFNTKLGVLQFYIWVKMRTGDTFAGAEFDENGSRMLPGVKPTEKAFAMDLSEKARNERANWEPNRIKYLQKILQLAKERGIQVTLIRIPEYHFRFEQRRSWNEIISFYESLAQSHEIPLLSFDADERYFDRSLYLDKAHFNRNGAQQFSKDLAERLRQRPEPGLPTDISRSKNE